MTDVHVCVPVLKRYDLLKVLALSLARGTIVPTLHVVDNGRRGQALVRALSTIDMPFDVFTPHEPLGVAASWNTFIATVPEERVIVNDDVVFLPDSLERLVRSKADIAWAEGVGFSCFLLRDRCVEKIGLFDAEISPGYAYYEDDDYLQRIDGRGTRQASVKTENVACGVMHARSSTLNACTEAEIAEHHRKFKIAQDNYIRKWSLEAEFERERVGDGLQRVRA